MILHNESSANSVYKWIEDRTAPGEYSVVTGYFTISALEYLAKQTNHNISKYRFVLGEIVATAQQSGRALDLLSESIGIEATLKLGQLAREAVEFLEQEKVQLKTLEPNFCHAKVYLQKAASGDAAQDYYISGSSNLTDAGIGRKHTNNIELNFADFGACEEYKVLSQWFDTLWERPQAHSVKTVLDETGHPVKVPFKQYLIDEIKKIFREYSPHEIYYKILFELFGEEMLLEKNDLEFQRKIGRLENTTIYNALFDFQQKGVLSLIKMLEKQNGAILADAVGLGKTWSALAVMKFYQLQGREVILLCPKKLQYNWQAYLKHQNSRFEKDEFEFFMRFHTDLCDELMHKKTDRADKLFGNDKPKLFVIDESHNLRNDKSQRYQFLLDEVLKNSDDVKVLMLSATPINNTLLDIRNQYKLIARGDDKGFEESLDVRSLEALFRNAQKIFNEWMSTPSPQLKHFISRLPAGFFQLTDALTVARTRRMIEGQQNGLEFPQKTPPQNEFVTPREIGDFHTFEELFDAFPPHLSGYAPSLYVAPQKDVDILHDEQQRDFFLIKMMNILLVKRLESSWFSFHSTVSKVLAHHENALQRIADYRAKKTALGFDEVQDLTDEDDELAAELENYTLGKKRLVQLSDIDAAGKLELYKKDLQADIAKLQLLQSNLQKFAKQIESETGNESRDLKLAKLLQLIEDKRAAGCNDGNRKVLIFTTYRDSATYLFEEMKKRGYKKLAFVSGSGSRVWNAPNETKDYEPILERFAPFTKLFREKEWPGFPADPQQSLAQQFSAWKEWVVENDAKTSAKLEDEIEILIATDALSEGQNLQDCDFVVNYDIHWNPVRVIQRMGRIDRLGSPNAQIFGVNFWPTDNINAYLNLQPRIEARMAAMKLAGAEVPANFTKTFEEMARDESLEARQKARMLEQMQVTMDDIQIEDKNLGFDDLSLELFRQELSEELLSRAQFYKEMPRGVYSGYRTTPAICESGGLVALLGHPRRPENSENFRYKSFELVYLDENGASLFDNQKEVLETIAAHKSALRFVSREVDTGEGDEVQKLSDNFKQWFSQQSGQAGISALQMLQRGGKKAVQQIKEDGPPEEKWKREDFDLIAWTVVSP